ncbi:prealbumin-like fold domain-containing protein [Bifidobacterium aquikefiri]|uniref:prealbumin-like fold domain-containing protein n=1 Tax=Bifidobacterium aquikefiri TaxID=1653207 RepID=UPI0039E98358
MPDHNSEKVSNILQRPCAALGTAISGVVVALLSMALCAGFAVVASADTGVYAESTTSPQITVTGDATRGHTFWAYKIAEYVDIKQANGKPTGVALRTLEGGVNSSPNTLSDGSTVGGSDDPLNFKQTLALEIAAIEGLRTGNKPTVDADGLIGGIDPLHWASASWQTGVSEQHVDPWLNTNTQTTGPFRQLADWLEEELGVTETNDCVAGTDISCFGLYFDQETGAEYADEVSRAVFDLDDADDAEISKVIGSHPDAYGAGLYVLLHPHPQDHYGTPLTGTHAPAMILGTKIPLAQDGSTKFFDMYNFAGTEVLHRLGTLNVKGDAVGLNLEIDHPWKSKHPTYPMGELVPYMITTNIPYFDNFLKSSGHAAYEGGRTAGSALANGTPILNAFGNQAAALQSGAVSESSVSFESPTDAGTSVAKQSSYLRFESASSDTRVSNRTGTQSQSKVSTTQLRTAQGSQVYQVADEAKNPIRFDIMLDYLGTGLSDTDPKTMIVTVGSTTLQYQQNCELGLANTDTPCFAFRQSASNAQGERYFVVQLPDWVLRANGGQTVTVQYQQRILIGAADDNGSIATKENTLATVEFTNNSYMHDYTDFTDSTMYGSIISVHRAVFTFPLIITKIDSRSNETLTGAEFTVSTSDVNQCFTLRSDVYHRTSSAPCGDNETQSLKADASGRVRIKGLEAHSDYRVQESKQPQGYSPDNLAMVDFTVTINPTYNSASDPTEVLATEYLYEGASVMHPNGLPAYLRPVTNEWINDVDHIKYTFYAHEIDVLNGKTSKDVDAIAPFPWDVLAKTGVGILFFALLVVALLMLGALLRWRNRREDVAESSIAPSHSETP